MEGVKMENTQKRYWGNTSDNAWVTEISTIKDFSIKLCPACGEITTSIGKVDRDPARDVAERLDISIWPARAPRPRMVANRRAG